jgi:phosphomannomutase
LTLIKSISGFRGTIGGKTADNLTPVDLVESAAAYADFLKSQNQGKRVSVIIGRDGRISGAHVSNMVRETLRAMGIDVLDAGLSTTPTIEMAVIHHKAQGGIIFTASHNPREWNALKLLNDRGEFLSKKEGEKIIDKANSREFEFAKLDDWGSIEILESALSEHVEAIVSDPLVLEDKIREKKYKVVVDCINSTGALAMPAILEALGCSYSLLNSEINGEFAHNPEPLSKNLSALKKEMKLQNADLGIAVDPDVDRLALVDENGTYIGEEYTLVCVADYIVQKKKGTFVSNLSSSKALMDWVEQHGGKYEAAAVGEVNVVNKMKEVNAVLGGEGNGGVIYPSLHYGRDALVGIAFVLSLMADSNKTLSALRSSYPHYEMIKDKLDLPDSKGTNEVLNQLEEKYSDYKTITLDGLKIYFEQGWVHLRASNTEPILRLYAEHETESKARELADRVRKDFLNIT